MQKVVYKKQGVVRGLQPFYAFHVFTPALLHRLETKLPLPVMAVRFRDEDFGFIRLFDRIEVKGLSSMEPLFDKPLPGTAGRGVAICFTNAKVVGYLEGREGPIYAATTERDPKDILAEVIREYEKGGVPCRTTTS